MLSIDLRGKRALVAGVADDGGYGFAIAKALAEAGATVCAGTWPPATRHRRPFARQWSRGQETAAGHESGGLPRRGERERLFPRIARGPAGTADASRRLVPVAHVHGERAGGAGLRGRHVFSKGGAGE